MALNLMQTSTGHSAYDLRDPNADVSERHTLTVLVDNESGVLARVVGLFSGRGYNIDSLTVAETDHTGHLSRITIVTTGTAQVIEQIKDQGAARPHRACARGARPDRGRRGGGAGACAHQGEEHR